MNFKAEQMLKGIRRLQQTYPATAFNIAKEFGNEAVKEGKQGIIPVDTGNLRTTARVEASEINKTVKFVTGGIMGRATPPKFVNYANYVNLGTSRQAPQFFMERSINQAASKIDSFSKSALNSWLKQL